MKRLAGPNNSSQHSLLGGLATLQVIAWGVLYYSFPVMLVPLEREFGWSQAVVTGAFSVALICSAIASVPCLSIMQRFGGRLIILGGGLVSSVLFALLSLVHSILAYYLIWAGIGFCMATVLYDAAFFMVARSLPETRDQALGIITFGGGLSGLFFIPLTTGLIERFGFRSACIVLAALLGGTVLLLQPLLKSANRVGERLDECSDTPADDVLSETRMALLRRGELWLLLLSFFSVTLAGGAILVHMIAIMLNKGFSPSAAAAIGATVSLASLPARLSYGWITSKWTPRRIAAALCALQGTALLILLAAKTVPAAMLFALVFGIGVGLIHAVRASLTLDSFGIQNFGLAGGLIAAAVNLARSSAPISAGILAAKAGSYDPVFLAGSLLSYSASFALAIGCDPPTAAVAKRNRLEGNILSLRPPTC